MYTENVSACSEIREDTSPYHSYISSRNIRALPFFLYTWATSAASFPEKWF